MKNKCINKICMTSECELENCKMWILQKAKEHIVNGLMADVGCTYLEEEKEEIIKKLAEELVIYREELDMMIESLR